MQRKLAIFQHLMDRLTYRQKIGIFIFGTGLGGQLLLENLRTYLKYNAYDIKGFFDNNTQKNGTMLDNIPVTMPRKDIIGPGDYIFIASDKYAGEIETQLLNMNVDKVRIIHPDQYLNELLPSNGTNIFKYDLKIKMDENNSHSLILRHIRQGSSVLEIGTATGYMTQYLKEELQCCVTGIEVDELAAAKAAVYTERMIVADLNEMKWTYELANAKFDYIIFADVLEHLRKPYEVFRQAVTFLKDNGQIIASLPNIAHNAIIMDLMQDKFNYNSFGLLDDSHIYFFTENTIRHLFNSSGLDICLWEKTIASPENTEFRQNYDIFPLSVKDYLQTRTTGEIYQFIVFGRKLTELLKNKRVVFWGSGLLNRLLQEALPVKVEYFVEGNSEKRSSSIINGLPVYDPSILLQEDRKDLIIIVASQLYPEVSERLDEMGFKERLDFYSSDLFSSFL